MTSDYVESTDCCYDCKKRKECPTVPWLYKTIEESKLITLIVQDCGGYE